MRDWPHFENTEDLAGKTADFLLNPPKDLFAGSFSRASGQPHAKISPRRTKKTDAVNGRNS
jgi:hypothetical protein